MKHHWFLKILSKTLCKRIFQKHRQFHNYHENSVSSGADQIMQFSGELMIIARGSSFNDSSQAEII